MVQVYPQAANPTSHGQAFLLLSRGEGVEEGIRHLTWLSLRGCFRFVAHTGVYPLGIYHLGVYAKAVRSVGADEFGFYSLVEVVQMEHTRNDMKLVTGAAFRDNQWGFAQVISLFLWIPLCIQSVYYGIRFVFPTRTTRPADPESAETVRVNIRDVLNSLHLRYPALNYPQYEERLRTHEIRELADVSKFDATFYNSKVGMDYGAAYLFCKWAADSEKRLKSWGDNLEEKTGAQGEPGDTYE